MHKNTICITGVTGSLGRNIFFEYLKQYMNHLEDIQLVLLGRASKSETLKNRIKDIFFNDGKYYLDISENKFLEFIDYLDKKIIYINMDLEKDHLGITLKDITTLSSLTIDIFYHPGAYTSFSDSNITKEKVNLVNTQGTQKLLTILKDLQIKRFCYFSSAFATGLISEIVSPSDLEEQREFRNPYENSKLQAELLVRQFEKEYQIPSYIFRTSILAGRLIEKNIGQIHKYDVFYGWTQFFIKTQESLLPNGVDIYSTPVQMNIRIMGSAKSTLNIIPADYAAKASIEIMSKEIIKYSSFHLVNTHETEFIKPILKFLNIQGYSFVNEIPSELNKIEKLYYRSVGRLFNDYMQNEGEVYFNYDSLIESLNGNVVCPRINEDQLLVLLEYAKKNNFGLPLDKKMYSPINYLEEKGA